MSVQRQLKPRHEQFAREYLIDLNATKAYQRAFPNTSEATARKNGHKLLLRADVSAFVAANQAQRAERTEVTADAVVIELAKVAFADVRTMFTAAGLKPAAEWTAEESACVAGYDASSDGGVRVRFHNKLTALHLLGKHLGMFTEKVELSGRVGAPPADTPDLSKLTDEELRQLESLLQLADERASMPPAGG